MTRKYQKILVTGVAGFIGSYLGERFLNSHEVGALMNLEELLDKLRIYERREISFLSQLYHFLAFKFGEPKMRLENGMLVISIDVDVGSRELGVINKGKNDANVNRRISEYRIGKIDETAFPLFFETFNDFEIPVTFAIRGQLTEVNGSILEHLLKSSVKHDIGSHGYSHREFTNLSRNEAENELNMISTGMKKFGVVPRSFVFPRNSIAHLDLLVKHEYKCYRGYAGFLNDRMYIEKRSELYDIHPSLYIDQHTEFTFLKKILGISMAEKLPLHIWFHLWNFGETKDSIQRTINKVFVSLLKYAKKKEKSGMLTFETMLSATEKVELMSIGD